MRFGRSSTRARCRTRPGITNGTGRRSIRNRPIRRRPARRRGRDAPDLVAPRSRRDPAKRTPLSWHRAIAAKALATAHHGDAGKIVKGAWPGDDRAALIARAAMPPLTTSGYPAYSPVVAFRSLAPSSAALQLFELGMALDLTGKTTIRIPNVSALPTQPIFVGEGLPAPNLQWSFASTILGPARKILMLSAVTSEMQNATPETASAVIGRVLSDKANRDVDATAFGTAAADTTKPAGLLHGVTPLTAAAAGVDAVFADRAALAGAIGAAGIDPSDIVYVCPPGEASFMRDKTGDKVLTTLGLPAKTVAAFAPAGILFRLSGPADDRNQHRSGDPYRRHDAARYRHRRRCCRAGKVGVPNRSSSQFVCEQTVHGPSRQARRK